MFIQTEKLLLKLNESRRSTTIHPPVVTSDFNHENSIKVVATVETQQPQQHSNIDHSTTDRPEILNIEEGVTSPSSIPPNSSLP